MRAKTFLRAALFCQRLDEAEDGSLSVLGVNDTVAIDVEGDGLKEWMQYDVPTWIRIEGVNTGRPHKLKLRFIDEQDRYLPGGTLKSFSPAPEPGFLGIEFRETVTLELRPPRSGDFRLLIELDGDLMGWIPLKAILTRSVRGDS